MPSLSLRIDLDPDGRVGPGKIALLEQIEATGSISAAARAVGMSYKRAWDLVEESNRIFGKPLVSTQAGGRRGGGAELTAAGSAVVRRYRAIEEAAGKAAARHIEALQAEIDGACPAMAAGSSLVLAVDSYIFDGYDRNEFAATIQRGRRPLAYSYMPGFGNDFETECLPGALPQGMNSPQRPAYGLYAEQLSGSPFTAPRGTNERSWLYRIRPSVKHHGRFSAASYPHWKSAPNPDDHDLPLGQLRWNPVPMPAEPTDFIAGMRTVTTAGDVFGQAGMAAHVYVANTDMVDDHFFNADGEMLVVPQVGGLRFVTEMGVMEVAPGEVCLLPRGLTFKVELMDDQARGYVCENYGAKFTLPDRGPIGANCLANPRDFKTPVAWFEDKETPCRLTVKWCGGFHITEIDHSPLDVVAWHGNYAPFKYDLSTFSPVGAILFDHPDPSIFTVLTAPSGEEGTANIDFVIFPPRWLVAENTFRPPWYHRNIMSEFMGLIHGKYDAKEEGFVPGGMSLHNMMLAHGPDADGFEKASRADLKPVKLDNTMAFMFETRFPQLLTRFAAELDTLQDNYIDCWSGLKKRFNGTPEGDWS